MAKTIVVNVSKKCNPRENIEDFRRSTNGCLYIGRRNNRAGFTKDSFWHNKYPVRPGTRKDAVIRHQESVDKFRADILTDPEKMARLPELVGKRLGCWCAPLPCHGNVLIELLAGRGLIDV